MHEVLRRRAEMTGRSIFSYSAAITFILICLFVLGGRINRKIEYPQSTRAYAGLAGPQGPSYADTGQTRRQIMKFALKRCYTQCESSYYYNTAEFSNACKSTCAEAWGEK